MSMASSAILSNFFEEKWKHKPTHNAFWDCRVHFFRQPFSKAVYTEVKEYCKCQLNKTTEGDVSSV